MTARSGAASCETAAVDAITRTDGCAGAVEGADGATHHTAAHNAANGTQAISTRRQAAVSSISVAQHA
jgi:hypothetical protein